VVGQATWLAHWCQKWAGNCQYISADTVSWCQCVCKAVSFPVSSKISSRN